MRRMLLRSRAGAAGFDIDFGPGVVRRAEAAALRGVASAEPGNLKLAFVTHLHSDHTAGYSDLIFTGWTAGRQCRSKCTVRPGCNR